MMDKKLNTHADAVYHTRLANGLSSRRARLEHLKYVFQPLLKGSLNLDV